MKILIVDDEVGIRNVIKEYCLNENYEVEEAEDGYDALDKLSKIKKIDLIVLDIMMPNMDGFMTLKEIKNNYDIPVIILSARADEYDKLQGFELGTDDYVTKPFSPKELIARIKAISGRTTSKEKKYIYKTMIIDYLGHSLIIDDKEVKITPKEYELLTFFVKNKGLALDRETLINRIWGYDFYGDDRIIDTNIKMLRNSLGKYRNLIITVRGMGYKYEEK